MQQRRQQDLTQQGRDNKGRIQEAQQSLEQLHSHVGKQISKLEQISRDTAKLWSWIQEHPDTFEKPVFGPPIIECSVKDQKYADMVESLFQKGLMLSFTTQTKNDFKTLSDIAHDKLRLSEVFTRTVLHGLEYFKTPDTSAEEMASYGFDGWALDLLAGPSPVLAMICSEIRLHETGYSLQDTTSQQYQTLQQSNIVNWVTKKATYRVSRRKEYGPGATSTQTKQIRKAQIWTDQPVDQAAKQPILDKVRDMEDQIRGWQDEINNAQTIIGNQRQIVKDCDSEHVRRKHIRRGGELADGL